MKTDAPTTPYMPMAGEGKKKKGFFSFLKKDKKFTVVSQVNQDNKLMVVIDLTRVVEGREIIVVK